MKVGIWGSYDKGNFGDDLMAIMFSRFLYDRNIEHVVFNTTQELKPQIFGNTITSIDQFVKESDLVIIGGGGMLVNNSVLRFLVKREAYEFEKSFYDLLKYLRKYNKKLLPFSIGGGENGSLNNPYKKVLFSSNFTVGGTVRLPSDLGLVDSGLFNYYPDVVLSANKIFALPEPESKGNSPKKRIILNLKTKNCSEFVKFLDDNIDLNSFEVYSFSSHSNLNEDYGHYEYVKKGFHLTFNTVTEALSHLSSADYIISSKLHVGVAAMSYGAQFISFNGPEKAKSFLKNEGLERQVINSPREIVSFLNNNSSELSVKDSIDKSFQHFERLENLMSVLS